MNNKFVKATQRWRKKHPFEYWISRTYQMMRRRVKGDSAYHNRGNWVGQPICKLSDFKEWAYTQEDVWEELDKKYRRTKSRKDAPSINRIDSEEGYMIHNLEIITVSENSSLGGLK